jgi:hypothetical protein
MQSRSPTSKLKAHSQELRSAALPWCPAMGRRRTNSRLIYRRLAARFFAFFTGFFFFAFFIALAIVYSFSLSFESVRTRQS